MNDKEDKYKKILLSRLYDIEIQKLEDENDKNLNKIINYMKKNKLLN